jgi:hypothetical protein
MMEVIRKKEIEGVTVGGGNTAKSREKKTEN